MFQQFLQEKLLTNNAACAIRNAHQDISYTRLLSHIRSVAAGLQQRGIEKEEIVALLFKEREPYIYGIAGVAFAGACFMPIDDQLPAERIDHMLTSVNCQYMICDHYYFEAMSSKAIANGITLICLDDLMEDALPAQRELPSHLSADDRLYIYFTSGSSGKPKAIVGKNSSLWHYLKWEISCFNFQPGYHFSQLISPGFDAFLRDVFVPLCSGGTLHLLTADVMRDPEALAAWVCNNNINVMHCVPGVFNALQRATAAKHISAGLKYVLLSGEPVHPADLTYWFTHHGAATQLVNLYGPTETTMTKTYYLIQEKDTELRKIPVGKPIPGSRILILNEKMQVCDTLVEGEIYIRTPYSTHGYFNTELNKDKFIINPFTNDASDVLYRTGDVGKWLADGNIDLNGRIDRQIKLNGVRIEPGEIENELLRYPGVSQAVVICTENRQTQNKVLVTFLTMKECTITEAHLLQLLTAHLRSGLPDVMVPAEYMVLPSLPRLTNDKIDYAALEKIYHERKRTWCAPESSTEETLLQIWSEVFKSENISVTDTFFEIGGYSLHLYQLINRIKAVWGVQLTMQQVYVNTTIRQQAKLIAAITDTDTVELQQTGQRDYYPLSSAQKRLYFLQSLHPGSLNYNMPQVLELTGAIKPQQLEKALQALLARHACLRTGIKVVDDQPVQFILNTAQIDLTYRNGNDIDGLLHDFIQPFDLQKGPLLRVGLLQTGRDKHFVVIDTHHIIADGISIAILIRDLCSLYNNAELPALPFSYIDYVQYCEQKANKEALVQQKAYWMNEMEGELPLLYLPVDYQRPAIKTQEASSFELLIDEKLTTAIRHVAASEEISVFTTLLAACKVLFARICHQDDIIIGIPIDGRSVKEMENVIGMFVNTLPVRSRPIGEKSCRDYLKEIQQKLIAAYDNQDYSYEQLVADLGINRDAGRNPLFDVMFSMGYTDSDIASIDGLEIKPYTNRKQTAKFDINMVVRESKGTIALACIYSTSLFKEETIARLMGCLQNVITALVSDPQQKLKDVSLISETQKHYLLNQLNDTITHYPLNETVVHLFKARATASPEKTALVAGGQAAMSFGELDRLSDALTCRLRSEGVAKGSIVMLCAQRSYALIIGIWGILKAGAAWLPVEPDYPDAHIHRLLESNPDSVILADDANKARFPSGKLVMCLDDESLYQHTSPVIWKAPAPEDTAYVIYTSGTSGRPKGVMISHQSLHNYINWAADSYTRTGERANLALCTSIAFDLTITSIFLPLVTGNSMIIFSDAFHLQAEKIIKHPLVDMLKLTPSHLQLLLDPELNLENTSVVKVFIVGGEAFAGALAAHIHDSYKGNVRIYNEYGPTEATVGCMIHCYHAEEDNTSGVPIGIPAANTRLYLLDKWLNPVPIGVPGELFIAGKGLALGYWQDTALTNEKFPENPFEPGMKMYRTGDWAVYKPDGIMIYKGRIDEQVKLRGHRIELSEIMFHLSTHPLVLSSYVAISETAGGSQHLCAYYISQTQSDIAGLRQYMLSLVPDYMVPAFFIRLDHMPLTGNGKIDRTALPEPELHSTAFSIAPSTDMEQRVTEIWEDVLNIKGIGVQQNFFEIGGNSLRLTIVQIRLSRLFGREIPLIMLYNYPTIQSLCNCLQYEGGNMTDPAMSAKENDYGLLQPETWDFYNDASF